MRAYFRGTPARKERQSRLAEIFFELCCITRLKMVSRMLCFDPPRFRDARSNELGAPPLKGGQARANLPIGYNDMPSANIADARASSSAQNLRLGWGLAFTDLYERDG